MGAGDLAAFDAFDDAIIDDALINDLDILPSTKLSRECAQVNDALCILGGPSSFPTIVHLLALAGRKTDCGNLFTDSEVLAHLTTQTRTGHASQIYGAQGASFAANSAVRTVRFRELMLNDESRVRWYEAWERLNQTGQEHLSHHRELEAIKSAVRMAIFAGRDLRALRAIKVKTHARHTFINAVTAVLLEPFDGQLFGNLPEAMQLALADEHIPLTMAGNAESKDFEEWVLDHGTTDSHIFTFRAALISMFRCRTDLARQYCQAEGIGPQGPLIEALTYIVDGQWNLGTKAFEKTWKALSEKLNRRAGLMHPTLTWIYIIGLLASKDPADIEKAKLFAEAEKRYVAQPHEHHFLDIWDKAILQKKRPKDIDHFRWLRELLHNEDPDPIYFLNQLLAACWLGIQIDRNHVSDLDRMVDRVSAQFDASGRYWLSLQLIMALEKMLKRDRYDAPEPFFVGTDPDAWRAALGGILALEPKAAPKAQNEPSIGRLIWLLEARPDGSLVGISAMEQKCGQKGLLKPKSISIPHLARRVDRDDLLPHDRAVLETVEREFSPFEPTPDHTGALPALVGHPCVAWHDAPLRFIEVSEALPALAVMTKDEHIVFRLIDPIHEYLASYTPARSSGPFLPKPKPKIMLLPDGHDKARLVRLTPTQLRAVEIIQESWKVPSAARDEIDSALRVLSAHFHISSDADVGLHVEATSVLRAELTPHGLGLTLQLSAVPFGEFGPRIMPGHGQDRITTVHKGVPLSTIRCLDTELANLQALINAAPVLNDSAQESDPSNATSGSWLLEDPQDALSVVEALGEMASTIITEWPKGKPLRISASSNGAFTLSAVSNGDWLDVDGQLEVDGGEVMSLRALLTQMHQNKRRRYVELSEGHFLSLSDALRQRLNDLNALGQPIKGQPHLQRLHGLAAMAWATSDGTDEDWGWVQGDSGWVTRRISWNDSMQRTFCVPPDLKADLRDYQMEGFTWLMRLKSAYVGACLADDMGLGKTIQTMAMLVHSVSDPFAGPVLIVAPTSVCGNWMAELARFAPSLRASLYGGGDDSLTSPDELADDALDTPSPSAKTPASTPAEASTTDSARITARRKQINSLQAGDVLVCSYNLLVIDEELLTQPLWNTVVLDEAQAIKNHATRRAKAAMKLTADFRLALTGTPIENKLGELWSLMNFCNYGLLGTAEQFTQRYVNPIERGTDPHAKDQALRQLRQLISPFLLRRKKADVLKGLPAITEIVHEVVPGTKERAMLEALRQEAQDDLGKVVADGVTQGQAQIHVLAALTRLRRAACDPRLVMPEFGSVGAKVQEFERLACELAEGGHRTLVFSQFVDFLGLLRERLDLAGLSYQYLDGKTPPPTRNKRVAAFQAGEGDFFLISLKAGGVGLNLTAADYVIITDPWWNPAIEDQASSRAHRMGQMKPVTVYRLVTKGSIEDKIVRLHADKRELADGILSDQDTVVPMTAEQMMNLLRSNDYVD